MGMYLPKILRHDATIFKAVEVIDGLWLRYEDMRPKAVWRGNDKAIARAN